MTDVVMAAHRWPTNADLILDHHTPRPYVGSMTRSSAPRYGRGVWWSKWRPAGLTAHDKAADGVDFTDLPYGDGEFDAAAYDPPYPPGRRQVHARRNLSTLLVLRTPKGRP